MTTYYVGPGGSDGNSGTSWGNRKLTLNGAEDIPVAAGDTVYVGPGTYRENLTCDVSGSAGSPITYIADVSGENTDAVGGIVRITGSDNDISGTRGNCASFPNRNYRTMRGFTLDLTTANCFSTSGTSGNLIIEDCFFSDIGGNAINFSGTGTTNTVRRCYFSLNGTSRGVLFTHTSTVDNASHLVENCMFISGTGVRPVETSRVGGITVKNCSLYGGDRGVGVLTALTGGQTITVNNSLFSGIGFAVRATVTGELVEDYNTYSGNNTNRTNVNTGSNSIAYPSLVMPVMLKAGYKYGCAFGELASYSKIIRIAGSGMSSDDLLGVTRPTTDSKKSWGAVQYQPMLRDTGTTHGSSTASLRLSDAGQHALFVPVTNVSTTFSIQVQWEADYAGTKPSMTIMQSGQSSSTDTATGSSGSWEELSITLTPAANPPYVVVVLKSSNTATSGNYDTFFDTLTVT